MNKIKLCIYSSYIVFLFVNISENNNFIKEIKHVLRAFICSLVKTSRKFARILEQVKTLECISGFHCSAIEWSQTFASAKLVRIVARPTTASRFFTDLLSNSPASVFSPNKSNMKWRQEFVPRLLAVKTERTRTLITIWRLAAVKFCREKLHFHHVRLLETFKDNIASRI